VIRDKVHHWHKTKVTSQFEYFNLLVLVTGFGHSVAGSQASGNKMRPVEGVVYRKREGGTCVSITIKIYCLE
jgi:hypothetical protein